MDGRLLNVEPSYWKNRWTEGTSNWHKDYVEPLLKKHFAFLTDGGSQLSIFVPLCGKTLDMVWLCEQGHSIVGCELSELAAQDFFRENNIPHSTSNIDSLKIYQATDRKIKLIVGNIYDCTVENTGQFDGMWECNALVAINPDDRNKYVDKLTSLTKPSGRILLSTYEYDQSLRSGFPHSLPPTKVSSLFQDQFTHSVAETVDLKGTYFLPKFNLPWALRHILYLQKNI